MKSNLAKFAVAVSVFLAYGVASAADPSSPTAVDDPLRSTTLKLIEALVDQGVLTREKANALIREASQPAPNSSTNSVAPPAAATTTEPPPGTVRVPYVPEFVRQQIKDEVKADLVAEAQKDGWAAPNSVPDWVRNMKWEGDIRVRFEHDSFADNNAPQVDVATTNANRSLALLNTAKSTDRERIRARIGISTDLDDSASVGVRLSTGSLTNPVSENQTLGSYESRYTTTFDRLYLNYRPASFLSTTLGRFENPLVGTNLIWADDLSFDGAVARYAQPFFDNTTRPFLTFLASPVQEIDLGAHNKYMFAWQGGVDQDFGSDTHGKLALGYYRYIGIEGVVSPLGTSLDEYTAPVFVQKGNTYYNISSDPTRPLLGLASSYRLVDVNGSVDTVVTGPYHANLTFDYVKNIGFDEHAVSARVGENVDAKTTGYLMRVIFGNEDIKSRNDWQVFATYKHVERDAVLDAFTDSDFHLGGTDAKGYVVGATYGLSRNTWAMIRYYSTDSISGAPLSIDTVQLDFNARF
jgi:hypothetical protein